MRTKIARTLGRVSDKGRDRRTVKKIVGFTPTSETGCRLIRGPGRAPERSDRATMERDGGECR